MGKPVLVLVVLIVVALGLAFMARDDRPAASVPKAAPRNSAAMPEAPVPAPAPAPQKPTAVVRENYPALKASADRGEIAAACEIAYELHRCSMLPGLQKQLLRLRGQAYELDEGSAKRLQLEADNDRRAAELESTRELCEGLDPRETREGWRYLLKAAEAGHLPSMLRFVHGMGLSWNGRPLDDLDQWTAYRDNMPAILERAIATGEPQAYAAAAKLYDHGPFGQSPLGRDPVKALAFRMALLRTVPEGQERAIAEVQVNRFISEEKLDATAVARAESLAATLAARMKTSAKIPFESGGCAGPRG